MPNPNGTAAVDTSAARVPCDDCGGLVPKDNISVHRAACSRRRRHQDTKESDIGSTSSSSVNLLTAYILWCLGGVFGLHHAYLNRPYQGLGWYATAGLFGWGLLRDLYRMPYYVSLARSSDDRNSDVAAKVRAATVQARNGVPRVSLVRIMLMGLFGTYFGWVASCLVALPQAEEEGGARLLWWTDNDAVYGLLRALGTAAGVWLVGNMGEETIMTRGGIDISSSAEFARLAVCCLASFAILDRPVLGGIYYAVSRRRYRLSMMCPTTSPVTRRLGRHLLSCAVFTALLAVATYNHGSIVVNDQKVYFHDALRNAVNSEFWHAFNWTQFREESSSGDRRGGGGGGDYLKNVFDLRCKTDAGSGDRCVSRRGSCCL
mmetsp:Transcript_4764/g.10837  ORF Transcript_4764/g.10837 Transcript_4764/m.10837 type:complete len:375 (-) Transcript_4764:733-1857(-)